MLVCRQLKVNFYQRCANKKREFLHNWISFLYKAELKQGRVFFLLYEPEAKYILFVTKSCCVQKVGQNSVFASTIKAQTIFKFYTALLCIQLPGTVRRKLYTEWHNCMLCLASTIAKRTQQMINQS